MGNLENNMKIIQIIHVPDTSSYREMAEREPNVNETEIFGLGDDGLVYFWIPESQEWHIYG